MSVEKLIYSYQEITKLKLLLINKLSNLNKKSKRKMFEAKLTEGYIFKKIIESIKDLVTDVNLDVSPSGK